MSARPHLMIRFRVDPEHEEEFNAWYNKDYLDDVRPIAPLFTHCFRQVAEDEDGRVYTTVYEIRDEDSIEEALAVFDREDRQEHRRQWQAWEKKAVHDFSSFVFRPFYSW